MVYVEKEIQLFAVVVHCNCPEFLIAKVVWTLIKNLYSRLNASLTLEWALVTTSLWL